MRRAGAHRTIGLEKMENGLSDPQKRRSRLSPTAAERGGQARMRQKGATPTGPKANARLLEATIGLCCRKGVAATSVDEIIEESRVARMTLYNRYGSKDALIHAALAHEASTWRAWLPKRPEPRANGCSLCSTSWTNGFGAMIISGAR